MASSILTVWNKLHIATTEAQVGQYILVHAGFSLNVLSDTGLETFKILRSA